MNSHERRRRLGQFYRGPNRKPETLSDRNWAICVAYLERREPIVAIAAHHGISPSAVSQILDGTVYRHLQYEHFARARRAVEVQQARYRHVRCTPEKMYALIESGAIHWRWMEPAFWERIQSAVDYVPPAKSMPRITGSHTVRLY